MRDVRLRTMENLYKLCPKCRRDFILENVKKYRKVVKHHGRKQGADNEPGRGRDAEQGGKAADGPRTRAPGLWTTNI